ncbi:FMN-binding protein [Opitutaceae bacterium]|nr:FMN-binding protein [Opitutaceae bacterium]
MRSSIRRLFRTLVVGAFCVGGVFASEDEVFLAPDRFVENAFSDDPTPALKRLWLTADLKPNIRKIMGHDYAALRLRYWHQGSRTAWILEEIGKVKPITTGFVVEDGKISQVQVLIYRESHGWEVKHPFFTDQFIGAQLAENLKLDRRIDSIAGATLSVNALRKMGQLALYLDEQVQDSSG